MFRISQSSRRRWFRAGFLLVCVAPLVALAVCGWLRHRVNYVRTHEAALRRTLGVRVQLGRVIHPRPGVVRYHDLVLADGETGQTIVRCRAAEVRDAGSVGKPVELVVQGVAIEPGAAMPLYAIVEQLLRGDFRTEELNVALSTDAISFPEGLPFPQLEGVTASIRSTEVLAEARIEFLPAAAAVTQSALAETAPAKSNSASAGHAAAIEERSMLRVVRKRQKGQAIDEFELHTGRLAIPCEALAPLAGGELVGLSGSAFQGSVWSSEEAGGWVDIRGQLFDVDLQRLVGDRFGHRIAGFADVQINRAYALKGRLAEADLTVTGGSGQISRSLLAAASDALRFAEKYTAEPAGELFPYKQLAAKARIYRNGAFQITGTCAQSPGAVLLAADGSPHWTQPREQPRPVSSLLGALAPVSSSTTPSSANLAWLLAHLPIEAVARREAPRNPAPTPREPARTPLRSEPPPAVREAPRGPRTTPVLPGPGVESPRQPL